MVLLTRVSSMIWRFFEAALIRDAVAILLISLGMPPEKSWMIDLASASKVLSEPPAR